jgi:hypothetical protein
MRHLLSNGDGDGHGVANVSGNGNLYIAAAISIRMFTHLETAPMWIPEH